MSLLINWMHPCWIKAVISPKTSGCLCRQQRVRQRRRFGDGARVSRRYLSMITLDLLLPGGRGEWRPWRSEAPRGCRDWSGRLTCRRRRGPTCSFLKASAVHNLRKPAITRRGRVWGVCLHSAERRNTNTLFSLQHQMTKENNIVTSILAGSIVPKIGFILDHMLFHGFKSEL